MQEIIVYIVIAIAACFAVRYFYKRIRNKSRKDECGNCKSDCGCCPCCK